MSIVSASFHRGRRLLAHAKALSMDVLTRGKLLRRQEADAPGGTGNFDVLVYFADGPSGIYQLRSWIEPLQALSDSGCRVVLALRNAPAAASLMSTTKLHIQLLTTSSSLESFIAARKVKGIFYVNNNQANFTLLRVNGPAHIHLSHGESEKTSMVSNQLKAYDFVFIAGQAAEHRILSTIQRYDASHLVEIGRPQLDFIGRPEADQIGIHSDRVTVLYCPTWEGDSPQMSYSSILSHGLKLVELVTGDPRMRLIFRPHPKTGDYSPKFRRQTKLIATLIAAAQRADPVACHTVDADHLPNRALREAHVMVTDVSAMAMDAVGLDIPLLLTKSRPDSSHRSLALRRSEIGATSAPAPRLFDAVEAWGEHTSAEVTTILYELALHGPSETQRSLRSHVLGPPNLGSGTERFIAATQTAISGPFGE